MRISISHNKTREGAMRSVDEAMNRLLSINVPPPVTIQDVERSWTGSELSFSLTAGVGPFRSPIRGVVTVTDTEIVIDCQLPKLLTSMFPEPAIQSGVESRVRGLLGGPREGGIP